MKNFNVATYEQLRDAIFEMSNDHVFGRDAANGPYTVTLRADITLDDSLPIIRALMASDGPAILFEGGGHTINGQDSHRAFFVESGNVEIRNLTIDDVAAIGGNGGIGGRYDLNDGGGGGGGLGAGAAIFVNTGAEVSVAGVEFADARAKGGDGAPGGGNNRGESGGGGGGIGGDGGDGGFGGGGGGGYQGAGGDGGDLNESQNAVGAGAGGGGGEFGDGGASAFERHGGAGGGGQQGDGGDAIQSGSAAGAGGGATADGGDVDDDTAGAGGADEGGDGGAEVANDTNGIDGQDGSALGGGGGGSAPGSDTNSSDTIDYVAGAGGDGGISGGGGGAGYSDNVGGNGGSGGGGGGSTGPASPGGQGGDFAGGGGAYSEGGQGGFGGGGGGGASFASGGHTGGSGGFGAGGGGGAVGGSGGSYGGNGGGNDEDAPGGGGAALGGAVFVRDGGRLIFNEDTLFTGSKNLLVGLGGNGSSDLNGSKLGESGFLHGSGTLALNAEAGTTWQLTVKGVAGDGTVEKVGAGTVILESNTVYRTETLVTAGTMELADANLGSSATDISSATVIKSGATLQGTGSVGELSVESGATLAPGAESGTIKAKDTVLSAGSTYLTDVGSLTDDSGNGTFDYDLLRVNGTLDLGNATLDASLVDEFIPELGKEIVLIDNDLGDAVSGRFAGLEEEGDPVSLDAAVFSISYRGGDGNDVSLTAVGLAPTALALDFETVAHSEGADATVGIFTTTDPDTDDTHVYSLVDGGADNALFDIKGDALTIKDPTSVADGAYTVRVATTDEDNLTFEKDFTISVEDDVQPTITSVKGPAAGNYETGDTLSFTVSFSELVETTEDSVDFIVQFDDLAVFVKLASEADTAVTEATAEYVIQAGDRDLNGIQVVFEPLNWGYEDVAGNELLYDHSNPPQIDFDPTGVTVNAESDGNPEPEPEPNPNPNPDPDPQPPVDNTIIPGSAVAIDATPNAGGSPVTVAGSPDEIDEVQIAGSVTLGEDLENAYLLGTGDYTVEGNSADNAIYGNAGNTTIIASAGNDTIDGGYGDNIVAFEGESSGYAIRVVDGIAEVKNLETGDVTGVANVAQLTFADGIQPLFATGQGMVAGFYDAFLGRELDQNGFEYWMDQSAGGMDPFEMVQHFIAPPEFGERTESLTTSQFVEWLYVGFLDREPDATGLAYWIDAIEGGTSYADAAANFVFAEEVGIRMDELLDRNDWLHIV